MLIRFAHTKESFPNCKQGVKGRVSVRHAAIAFLEQLLDISETLSLGLGPYFRGRNGGTPFVHLHPVEARIEKNAYELPSLSDLISLQIGGGQVLENTPYLLVTVPLSIPGATSDPEPLLLKDPAEDKAVQSG